VRTNCFTGIDITPLNHIPFILEPGTTLHGLHIESDLTVTALTSSTHSSSLVHYGTQPRVRANFPAAVQSWSCNNDQWVIGTEKGLFWEGGQGLVGTRDIQDFVLGPRNEIFIPTATGRIRTLKGMQLEADDVDIDCAEEIAVNLLNNDDISIDGWLAQDQIDQSNTEI